MVSCKGEWGKASNDFTPHIADWSAVDKVISKTAGLSVLERHTIVVATTQTSAECLIEEVNYPML